MRILRRALRVSLAIGLCLPVLAGECPATEGRSGVRLNGLPTGWRDDRGRPFELRSLHGHIVVLTMAYASCHRVCPLTIERLRTLQRDFDATGTDATFVIVGYDPEADDPLTWRQYRRSRRLTRENWHFLVGSRPAVAQLAHQLGFELWHYDQHVMHDARIVYFDESGVLGAPDSGGPSGGSSGPLQ